MRLLTSRALIIVYLVTRQYNCQAARRKPQFSRCLPGNGARKADQHDPPLPVIPITVVLDVLATAAIPGAREWSPDHRMPRRVEFDDILHRIRHPRLRGSAAHPKRGSHMDYVE